MKNGITDETCSIYQATGRDNGKDCSTSMVCKNCNPHEPCFIPEDGYFKYEIEAYGGVYGELGIMMEVMANGPVACGIAATEALENDYTGGIF